ncbi:hypothetical protein N0V90_012014 [Kalmusia sp. IMI 367209]|nr:hypothetical protein N0V90_012014 [Kalmusia sp. IMI 367209]
MLQSSLVLALAGLATFSSAAPTAHKRQGGGKRGLGFKKDLQDKANLFTGAGKVSWAYDWEARSTNAPSFNVPGVEFVPMLHDDGAMFTGAFPSDAEGAIAAGAKHILSINEPDICGENTGGACMDVGRTVTAHKTFIQPLADKYPDVKIVSPAYSNSGVDAMKQFLASCDGCRIDAVATHWYGAANTQQFIDHVTNVHNWAGKPVWVTEFASWEGDEQFLKDVMGWMDTTDFVERYAYFSVESSMTAGNSLNNLGNIFAAN